MQIAWKDRKKKKRPPFAHFIIDQVTFFQDNKHDSDLRNLDAAMDVLNNLAEVNKIFNDGLAVEGGQDGDVDDVEKGNF